MASIIETPGRLPQYIHVGKGAAVSVLDQAIFSGTMFVLNILLIRWISPEQYGAFAVIFAIFLILAGLHNALVVEPMTIYGAQKNSSARQDYLRDVYLLHFVVMICLAAIAAVVAVFLSGEALQSARWALPITTPLVLCFWLARRVCYLQARPLQALVLSSSYAVGVLLGITVLQSVGKLSSFSAFIMFGLVGFLVSLLPIFRLLVLRYRCSYKDSRSNLLQHWVYGKWSASESIVFAFGTSIFPLAIAYFGNVMLAGQFRAIQLLFLPLIHILIGLNLMLLPWLATANSDQDPIRFSRGAYAIVALFVAIAFFYTAPVIGLGDRIVMTLYQNNSYLDLVWLLPYLGVAAILGSLSAALMMALRASERPDQVFLATTASSISAIVFGTLLVATLDLQGVAIAIVLSSLVSMMVLAWSSRGWLSALRIRAIRQKNGGPANV